MDIFISKIPFNATEADVRMAIADVLDSDRYACYSDANWVLNFHFNFDQDAPCPRGRAHGGRGYLTLLDINAARQLLLDHGGKRPAGGALLVKNRPIFCEKSRLPPYRDILQALQREPYIEIEPFVEIPGLPISSIQFGWECRDGIFSLEWSRIYLNDSCRLLFDRDRNTILFRGQRKKTGIVELMEMKYSQVKDLSTSDTDGEASIFLFLSYPPSFQTEVTKEEDPLAWREHQDYKADPNGRKPTRPGRRRHSSWDDDHGRVVPFVSTAIRLVCGHPSALTCFREMAADVGLWPGYYKFSIIRRKLFVPKKLENLERWLAGLAWPIAYHLDQMHKNLLLDTPELLSLRAPLDGLIVREGFERAALVVRYFAQYDAPSLPWKDNSGGHVESALDVFRRRVQDSLGIAALMGTTHYSDGVFDCIHVVVTPTCVIPKGIFPDRSNRVLRWFPGRTQYFIRVTFAEESILCVRHDRLIDTARFINERFGHILRNGLTVCGRKFDFLAYSQSALKDHAVWMVRPFADDQGRTVTAATIRQRLGSFPPDVLNCPALYAARISQAFTATDPSVTVEVSEIRRIRDVVHRERDANHKIVLDAARQPRTWEFTDGVGTISPELADQITLKLVNGQKRQRKWFRPRVFQIRLGGAKGMVSVDCRLAGRDRVISLRPSMIKFSAETSRSIEIAQSFHRPTRMVFNRPLIMLLEDLGVDGQRFLDLQQECIEGVQASTHSITSAAAMLESHGLGPSFHLTSVFLGLHKLGFDFQHQDPALALGGTFIKGLMHYSVNHILRELKNHARIPVPGGYTLVGVADIHRVLRPFEIFCCVQDVEDLAPRYLEGRYIVTRSPVCHPGDAQWVRAIGRPPKGSPYDTEPLANSVVFSTEGPRPIASYLGGGDLDGDEYNLIPEGSGLCPESTCNPAPYAPPERKRLDRPSTINDIADFVVDYINNDNIGLVATRWLTIADQTNIFHESCMQLSKLHSDAVDFPKTGLPVSFGSVPRAPKGRKKPDWSAPETMTSGGRFYYQSQKAIGKLFRAIELPSWDQHTSSPGANTSIRTADMATLESAMSGLRLGSDEGRISVALRPLLGRFITLESDEDDIDVSLTGHVFDHYASTLRHTCTVHTISEARRAVPLNEIEVVVGTIAAKTSQRRRREQAVAKMREASSTLVDHVLAGFAGDEKEKEEARLRRAWTAWLFASNKDSFGARSFGILALVSIFDALRKLGQRSSSNESSTY